MRRTLMTALLVGALVVGMSGTVSAGARDLDVEIVTLKNPVAGGEQAELVIQTEIGAMCLGNAWPELQPSQRAQLSGKTVHGQGQTSWTWTIPKTAGAGPWTIDLQCATTEKKARLNLSFEVR